MAARSGYDVVVDVDAEVSFRTLASTIMLAAAVASTRAKGLMRHDARINQLNIVLNIGRSRTHGSPRRLGVSPFKYDVIISNHSQSDSS